ncbi:16519_t:CDS:2, partial [Cetraspora pellucida]
KSYEEEQYLKTGHNECVQVIERLLIKYKKELEQAQSNYNQRLKDQYYSSKIDLHVDKILYLICNLENENASLLKQTISLRRDNIYDPKDVELIKLNENLSKTIDELKNEKDTIFAVKSENNQLLAKLKQLQKTNHTTQTIGDTNSTIIDVIPTQSFRNLEENKQLFLETVTQKYEAIYNYLGYKIEIFDDNDVYLTLVEDDDNSDSDM